MSKKPKKTEEAFSPEQLEKLEHKGDKDVQLQRQKEGIFQRYHARRDSQDIAKQVRWKRRSGVAIVVILLVLFLLWIVSWLLTTIGDLVISVDSTAAKKGITITANADGSDQTYKLSANMASEVTNITYDWLPATLDIEGEGSHNGRNYLAYTFYLANNGSEDLEFISQLKSVRDAKDADEALRVMVYRNGVPTIYAKPNITKGDDGKIIPLETRYVKVVPDNYKAPEETVNPEEETQNKEIVPFTDEPLELVEFTDDETVFSIEEKDFKPGDKIKYTIVCWIEGDDPECIDVIRGGYVKLMWDFSIKDEEL